MACRNDTGSLRTPTPDPGVELRPVLGWQPQPTKRYSAAADTRWSPGLREQTAMALLNKGTTLMELQPAAAIEAFDQIVERYGRAAEPALRGETAAALLNKGAALIMLGQAGEAVAAYELMVERYGDRPGPRTPQDRGGGPQTAVRAPRDGGEGR